MKLRVVIAPKVNSKITKFHCIKNQHEVTLDNKYS